MKTHGGFLKLWFNLARNLSDICGVYFKFSIDLLNILCVYFWQRRGLFFTTDLTYSTGARNCAAFRPISEEIIEKTARNENRNCVWCIKVTSSVKEGLL